MQQILDFTRREDLAGRTVTQTCGMGIYSVTYDENGYITNAMRLGDHNG